jgi:hypothetical protein
MKRQVLLVFIALAPFLNSLGQENRNRSYRNFPLIITVQFHALALPFKDLIANFSNPGIGVGTEFSYNGNQNWVQQFSAIWYRNRNTGNGIMWTTQIVWRPTLSGNLFTEIKVGIGYHYSFRPVESYNQKNAAWLRVGHKGKSMFVYPVGVSVGYNNYTGSTAASPFISYQFLLLTGYNKSIPLVPETLLQVGTRVR